MIGGPTHETVFYVAANMRAADKREIYPLLWMANPYYLTERIMSIPRFVFVAGKDVPVAVFGAHETRPACWTAFCFATEAFPTVALEVTRFLKTGIKPHLFRDLGANRVEADSHIEHTAAHRWLKLLGAKPEGVKECFNKNGDSYVNFVMSRKDWELANATDPAKMVEGSLSGFAAPGSQERA